MQTAGKETVMEKVRERAYAIWEREGRPHGRDREHWLKAEQEVMTTAAPARPAKKAANGNAAAKAASTTKAAPGKRAATAAAKATPKTARRKTAATKKK